jgi:glycosyltransferase involved in cell wall biosynthesis
MIFKNEADQFRRILTSYGSLFDEIVVAVDEKIEEFQEIAKSHKNVKVLPYTWKNDFSDKRNFVQKNITGDYYVRIDADDAIRNPSLLRAIAEKARAEDVSIVYLFYAYSLDQWGNINAAHWRETIIKNTDNLFWNKKIHENIIPKSKADYRVELNDEVIIDHLIDEEHINQSMIRNIKYLIDEYNQDKEKTDPRTLAYLGRTFHGVGEFDKATFFLEKHIQSSGWDEDRFFSWCQLADINRLKKNYSQAMACAFEALSERPDFPDAYLKLHDIYFDQENWEKAEEWGRQGLIKPQPRTFMLLDPSSYGWRPVLSLAFTLFQRNKFDEALKLFQIAQRQVPTLDFIKQNESLFKTAVEHKRFMEHYLSVLNYLKDSKEEDKIPSLLLAAPKNLKENEIIIKLKHHFLKPKDWEDKSVCIFAPNELPDWSPKSVDQGIGGSEEAVIYLSKEIAKLGFKVTVFNNCGLQAGIYDGVEYINAIEFNPQDRYNILISWRNNIFEGGIRAKKRILWLHDCPASDFGDDNVKRLDKIVVLSQYHASLLPKNIPQDKIFVSTNGINAEDFVGLETIPRDPHRVIYASSYNRGLEKILEIWPDVRQVVSDASLHIYYGWETYDDYAKKGWLADGGFKQKMMKLMDQPGVVHHGRIGHKELLKEYAKAGVFAYPCTYKGEINCIALTKAIACGCIAVTNDFAVMKERNPDIPVRDEEFKDTLITVLKNGYPKLNTKEYIEHNSWTSVAKDWAKNLFIPDHEVVLTERAMWIWSQIDKNAKIVDIGSNKGHLFADFDRTNIWSVDLDKYDLPNFVQADAAKMPFEDKQFDVAVLGEIVEHTDDPVAVLREAMRVSKKLIITVPWEHKWTSELLPFEKIEDKVKREKAKSRLELAAIANPATKFYTEDNFEHLYHKHFFTPETFKEQLAKADIVNYKWCEIRCDDWAWIGVVCE